MGLAFLVPREMGAVKLVLLCCCIPISMSMPEGYGNYWPLLEIEEARTTILADSNGNGISGEIIFAQADDNSPLRISGIVRNLPPGAHGFHVHEKKQTGNDCKSSGGHWDPEGTEHGSRTAKIRHAGDFGSIVADKNGVAIFDFEIAGGGSSTLFGENALTDRSLVIHEIEDDFGQPTGNAGSRLACGVLVKTTAITEKR